MLLRLNRNEDVMSKDIIHNINKVAELANPARVERHTFSDEQLTGAGLVLPRTGYALFHEFARILKVLGGERDFA